jgi:hypothetical protein
MRAIKYSPIILAFLLAACNKYDVQPEQAEGFIKYFSSTLTEQAYDVKETADGGYVAIGTTSDEEGLRDIYMVKTDKYGNEESWSPVTIGGDYDDVGTSIQVVSDGYVILGYSTETDSTGIELYLVKTDLQGSVVWEVRYGDERPDGDVRGTSLQVTSTGEYLTVGRRYNQVFGKYNYRIVLFKTNGDVIKDKIVSSLDLNASVLDAYIIETQANYIICGTENYLGKNVINAILLVKESLSAENNEDYTHSGDLTGNCIQELSDGNLLICGTRGNPSAGLSDIYLNKISASLGTVIGWETAKTFRGDNAQVSLSGNSVRIIDDNSYAILGTRTETRNDDIILLHADAGGNEVSRHIYGDDGFQQGMSLEITGSDGGLILVGNNGSEDNSMIALVKTDASGKL